MSMRCALRVVFAFSAVLFLGFEEARAAEDSVLSLDRTLVIQMVVFVVAIFIFNHLLFKPLLRLSERRQELTAGAVREAEELEQKTEKLIEDYEARIREARARFFEEREESKRKAQEEALRVLNSARSEAQALVEEERRRLEAETKDIRERIKPQIEGIARDITARILGREV